MEINISKPSSYLVTLNKICQQIFSIFLIGYLFFFLLDEIFDGFMSNFINLNYLLIVVIISGAITAIFGNAKILKIDKEQIPRYANLLCLGLALLAIVIIFIKIYSFGIVLSLIISILSGILIWLISYLFLTSAD